MGGSYVLKKEKKNLISISLLNFQSCFFLLLLPLCSHPVSPQVGIRAGQGSVFKDLKRFLQRHTHTYTHKCEEGVFNREARINWNEVE